MVAEAAYDDTVDVSFESDVRADAAAANLLHTLSIEHEGAFVEACDYDLVEVSPLGLDGSDVTWAAVCAVVWSSAFGGRAVVEYVDV